MLASSASNVQDQLQRQPTKAASEQPQQAQPASQPHRQHSRRGSREQLPKSNQAGHAMQPDSDDGAASGAHSGSRQLSGSFSGGQPGAGQLTAALGAGALSSGASAMQMPYPSQGEGLLTSCSTLPRFGSHISCCHFWFSHALQNLSQSMQTLPILSFTTCHMHACAHFCITVLIVLYL